MVCGGRVSHPAATEGRDSLDPHHQENTRQLLQTGDISHTYGIHTHFSMCWQMVAEVNRKT